MRGKRFWVAALAGCLAVAAHAYKLEGTLQDAAQRPVEYANVQLLGRDSSFVAGTVSDRRGAFMVEADGGDYLLRVSMVGYATVTRDVKNVAGDVWLGTIVLEEATNELDSITVTAHRIIRRIDRQIAFPGKLETESSATALELLKKMSLPLLKVDDVNRSVSMVTGGSVQLRINGRPATVEEAARIPSKDIIRIEYHDNPGVRIQEEALVDFIVRRREAGGQVVVNTRNAVHLWFSDDDVTFKVNHGRSEWSGNYTFSYRDYDDAWNETTLDYTTPEGEFSQKSDGIPSPFYYQTHTIDLSYNYTKPDKRMLNVLYRGTYHRNNSLDRANVTYSEHPEWNYTYEDRDKDPYSVSALDLFYKEEIDKTQRVYADLWGSYTDTDYDREYIYRSMAQLYAGGSYVNRTKGKKYSLIAEADYEKEWDKVKLYAGGKYSWGHADNRYRGTTVANTEMTNSDLYLYTQLTGRYKKLSYQVGVGVSYAYFDEGGEGYKFWTFRPSVSLNYQQTETGGWMLRYDFRSLPSIPSLSSLSDVEQDVDPLVVSRGTPGLKPYRYYANAMMAGYVHPKVTVYWGGEHYYYDNVIMTSMWWDDTRGKFVSAPENQKHYQTARAFAGLQWQVVKDVFNLSFYGMAGWMESKGNNFRHTYTSLYGWVSADFYWKGWNLGVSAHNRFHSLWGESLSYGEWPGYGFSGGYRYKDWYFGLYAWGPFTDAASYYNESLREVYRKKSWRYIGQSSPIYMLQINWNFNWGRKSKAGKKTINNSDSDTGILRAN